MSKPKNHVALVTGASRGIGREIARALSKADWKVALLGRSPTSLAATAKLVGKNARVFVCDVSDEEEIHRTLIAIKKSMGEIGALVNCAGQGGPFHLATEVSTEEWNGIFSANVDSIHFLTKRILPEMKKNRFGRIIHISSILGLTGNARSSTYSATKHAVIGYMRSLASEWGRYGITANAVCPGFIDTQMTHQGKISKERQRIIARIPVGRFGRPEEVASLVEFLARHETAYINGSAILIDGGLLSHID